MKAEDKQMIARDTLWYTSSVYFAQFLGFFSGILTRRFLEPSEMGVWVLLQTFLSYGLFAELGILTAMYCRVPAEEGKGDKAAVQKTYNTAFTFSFAAGLAAALFFAAYGFFAVSLGPTARIGIAVTGLLVVLTLFYNFYVNLMWAWNFFGRLGWIVIGNAILTFLAVFVFVRPFGLKGLYASTCLLTLISAGAAYFYVKARPSFCWDWEAIKGLLKFGFPIFAGGMIYTMFLSLDRLMIARSLGATELGFYSIAVVVFSFASTAPKMFSIVLFPRMRESYAATGSMDEATHMVLKPDLVIAFLSPVVLGLAYFLLPFLVGFVLPKYWAGVRAAQLLLLGSFFVSLIYNAQSFLITVEKRTQMIPFILFAAAVGFLANTLLLKAGLGIEGVALGMGAAFFAYFVSITYYVLRHFLSVPRVLSHIAEILAAYAYFLAMIGALERLPDLALRCGGFLLASLPVLCWAQKRTSVFTYGLKSLRRAA